MRRDRTNNTLIFIYSLAAILLVSFLIFYIYMTRERDETTLVEHPQVGNYQVAGEILQVSVGDRLLTVRLADGEQVFVGLLSTTVLLDQRQQNVELNAFQPGNWVEVDVDFIGTGAVLASQVMLFD